MVKKVSKKKSVKKQVTKKTSISKKKTKTVSKKNSKSISKDSVSAKPSQPKPVEENVEESALHYEKRWCAALSYLVVGIIWYFLDERLKKDSFVKFHVKQGLVLLVAIITLQVLASLIMFLSIIWLLIGLFLLIMGLTGVVHALENKEKPMLLIGKYAEKF